MSRLSCLVPLAVVLTFTAAGRADEESEFAERHAVGPEPPDGLPFDLRERNGAGLMRLIGYVGNDGKLIEIGVGGGLGQWMAMGLHFGCDAFLLYVHMNTSNTGAS